MTTAGVCTKGGDLVDAPVVVVAMARTALRDLRGFVGSYDRCPTDNSKKRPSTNGGYDSSDLPEGVYETLVAAISEKVTEATTTAPTASTQGPVAADME
ncbi:hypothetical protein AAVH_31371, partial [Aphelenchoides avenae]